MCFRALPLCQVHQRQVAASKTGRQRQVVGPFVGRAVGLAVGLAVRLLGDACAFVVVAAAVVLRAFRGGLLVPASLRQASGYNVRSAAESFPQPPDHLTPAHRAQVACTCLLFVGASPALCLRVLNCQIRD